MGQEPSLKDFACALDKSGHVKTLGARPLRVEKIFVEQRTRIPAMLMALSGAALLVGLGYAAYQYGSDIQHQRVLAEKRLEEQRILNGYIGANLLPEKPKVNPKKNASPFTITQATQTGKKLDVRKVADEKFIPTLDGNGYVPAFTVQIPPRPAPEQKAAD